MFCTDYHRYVLMLWSDGLRNSLRGLFFTLTRVLVFFFILRAVSVALIPLGDREEIVGMQAVRLKLMKHALHRYVAKHCCICLFRRNWVLHILHLIIDAQPWRLQQVLSKVNWFIFKGVLFLLSDPVFNVLTQVVWGVEFPYSVLVHGTLL